MYTKDLHQALKILRDIGVNMSDDEGEGFDQGGLLEFTLKNLEKVKKLKNPTLYLEEKIEFLKSLYGQDIWEQTKSSDPLVMLDSYKAGILRTMKNMVLDEKKSKK